MKISNIVPSTLRARKNLFLVILVWSTAAITSQAQTLTTLLDFNGTDGAAPRARLTEGFDGNFYGTTLYGGTQGYGTSFRVTPTGVLTTIHNFCSVTGCADGSSPYGAITQASNGDFYGPTDAGGTGNAGVIYRITSTGQFEVLHNFCVKYPCADGIGPNSVVQSRNGKLYGATSGSHENSYLDLGTAFEMTLSGTLTTLHSFSGPDGSYPQGALLQASNGDLYGTTGYGGSTNCVPFGLAGCGTVFQITPSGTLTVLHMFHGRDGAWPGNGGALIEGADGNLYGTTTEGGTGGTRAACIYGCGTIFKITPAGKFTTIYNFCSQTKCADGAMPSESLAQGTDGNFYGTTINGGNSSSLGTIFKITPQGVLSTLYDFCSQPNCADGMNPLAALIQATDGNFYGTTNSGGGQSDSGTVFRFSTGLGPFVRLLHDSGKVGQIGGVLGQGFLESTGVFLNGIPSNFTVISDTMIRITVPSGATTGYVTVTTPSGILMSNVPFRVLP